MHRPSYIILILNHLSRMRLPFWNSDIATATAPCHRPTTFLSETTSSEHAGLHHSDLALMRFCLDATVGPFPSSTCLRVLMAFLRNFQVNQSINIKTML
jgi:hypothetical protein